MADRSDNFNRANGAIGTPSDGGGAYTTVSAWSINSNTAYNSGNGAPAAAVLDSGTSDVEVQVTLPTVASGSGQQGVCFRFQDSSNFWYARSRADTSNLLLLKRIGGSPSTVGTYTMTPANGDVIKVIANGGSIDVYLNGSPVISVTGQTDLLTATKHGMFANANTTARFEDLTITDYSSGAQLLLPSADITTTGWTSSAGGALYAAIDESVASDSDYIYTGTLDAECEVRLQSGSTPGAGSKNLSVRVPAGFTPVGGWLVSLYQGASLVQSFTSPAPAANTTATFSVTNAITDYSDLRVRIKSTA